MPSTPEPWTRGARIALLVVTAIASGGLLALHHPWYEASGETAWTLAAARGLATGDLLFHRPLTRVPGFVHAVSLLAGGERLDLGRIHMAMALAGGSAVVLLFFYQRPRLGWPLAALATLGVAATPAFFRSCNRASDLVPGTALLLACLLVEEWSTGRPSSRRSFVSGLAIGLNAWVRPLHLLLLPAVLVARTARRTETPETVRGWTRTFGREHGPIALGVLVAILPLLLGHCTLGRMPWDPPSGASTASAHIASLFGNGPGGEPTNDALLWSLGITIGLFHLTLRRGPAGGLVALAVGLAVLTPAFELSAVDLLPVLAIGLPALLGALRDGFGRTLGLHAGTVIACVVAGIWIGTVFDPASGRRSLRAEHENLVEFADQVDSQLQEGSKLASGLGLHLALFVDRPVIAIDVAPDEKEDVFEAWIDRHGVDTIALYPRFPTDMRLVPYVLRRYGERDPDRVVTIPPGFLVRVRP
jgi:hypothetical protein